MKSAFFVILMLTLISRGNLCYSQAPFIQISGQTDTICEGQNLSFSLTIQDCPLVGQVQWLINGAVVANESALVFNTSNFAQNDLLSATVACTVAVDSIITLTSVSAPIQVYSFILDAGPDLFIDSGQVATFLANGTAESYLWSPPFLVLSSTNLLTAAQPTETTTFTLKGVLSSCVKFDYVTVFVKGAFKIPNTFSPNSDGLNETWVIPGIENYPENAMVILNRFGHELYKSSPYTIANSWTGNYNDKPLPEGVYFYILDLGQDKGIRKGTISIIR